MNKHIVYKRLIGLVFVAASIALEVGASPSEPKSIPDKSPAEILTLAESSSKKGDYAAAIELLWKNIDRLDRRGLILLTVAYEKKSDSRNMIKVATMLVSKNPKDHEGHYLLGSGRMLAKDDPGALESLKTALEINPKYEPAYEKLSQMYTQKKNYYELRILYQDMLEKVGKKSTFLNKLCEINAALDYQEDQALSYCKQAISKDPKTADNYVYLGLIQKNGGEDALAKKTLKTAADSYPKSDFAQYTFASLMDEQKNYVDAAKYYSLCTVANPDQSRCWDGYARSNFEIHKFDLALEGYKKACRLDRKYAASFRRASNMIKNMKDDTWTKTYEKASESCSGY